MKTKLYNGTTRNIGSNQVAVDPQKFKAILKRRGLTQKEVNRKIGYASNAIASALNAGAFVGPVVSGLRTYFAIEPEEYQYVPPKEEPKEEPKPVEEQPEANTVTVEDSALYATMKKAIMDAMADTTGFYGKWLHNIMKQAMQEALKG